MPVMKLEPNAYGLYDMHGNAFEWCRDFYDRNAYREISDTDPYYQGSSKTKVVRGGSYDSTAANLRSANRTSLPFAQRELLGSVGFRVLLEIKQ